ncbi:hypothetical protein BH10PSE19_BH10PSE19_06680 [soil metagenome]
MCKVFIFLLFCGLSGFAFADTDFVTPELDTAASCERTDDSKCAHHVPSGKEHCLICEKKAFVNKNCNTVILGGKAAILCSSETGSWGYFCNNGNWSHPDKHPWICQ